MYYRFFLFFALLNIELYAQNGPQVEVVVGPNLGYRQLSANKSDLSSTLVIYNRQDVESYNVGWVVGTDLHFSIQENWSIRSGMRLSREGFILNKNNSSINYYFVSMQVAARYKVRGRLQPFVEVGIVPSANLGQLYISKFDGEVTRIRQPVNELQAKHHLSAMAALGLVFPINTWWAVTSRPYFLYHLTPTFVDVPIRENLHSFGLELGLRRSFVQKDPK